MIIVGSTSPRSKTTPDLQNDNNPRKIPFERCDCEPNKYTGDDQGRAEVNHTSLGAGQVKIGFCVCRRRNSKTFTDWLKANVFRSLTVQLKTRLAEGEHIAFCAGVFIFSMYPENYLKILQR